MQMKRMAMAWLREEDWPRWRELDPTFVSDYQKWLRRMNEAEAALQAKGITVVKIEVVVEEFVAWADATGQGMDSNARAAYAATRAHALDAN